MLREQTLLQHDGVEVVDVACRHARGRGGSVTRASRHTIVFVRRGCFLLGVDGVERLLDPVQVYCTNPGQEQRYGHPHDGGDDCTSVRLSPELIGSIWGEDATLPDGPSPSTAQLDLTHRRLLASARRGDDPDDLVERAVLLAAATLARHDTGRVSAGRPATGRARRALVEAARESLVADPDQTLVALAGTLSVSPHHLSRLFRAGTGHVVSRYRTHLRVRAAMERLGDGETDLARLAADLGFVDQSHLTRAVRAVTGRTPTALRRALRVADRG